MQIAQGFQAVYEWMFSDMSHKVIGAYMKLLLIEGIERYFGLRVGKQREYVLHTFKKCSLLCWYSYVT